MNVIVSRGVRRMFAIAEAEYRRTLDAHAVLDFHDVLLKALQLLRQMEEFAQSRYRLEARYHHVLVDEFQDTSRAQWELVELLIASWGEGAGLTHTGPLQPSVFIVGDRKQSIYGFRDADVSVLRLATRHLESLRPGGDVQRSISRSFRSVPAILAFINDLCQTLATAPARGDAFRYEEGDRFPVEDITPSDEPLALVPGGTPEECAETIAGEVRRLIDQAVLVRDRDSGLRRPVRAGDVAILFRSRDSHREFEQALEKRGIPAYVYKGLGFFDADEIKDTVALMRYLADPTSDLRAAALLRSGFGGLSDEALRRLAPRIAGVLEPGERAEAISVPDDEDRSALDITRRSVQRWCSLVDWMPPAELLDLVLEESAYAVRLAGPRLPYARENLKKIRALIRRIQNRGYTTMARIADHLDRLAVGDEPNAVIDALDAVSLMTVHAAKGLEFPVVFLVNASRGTGNRRDAIRVAGDPAGDAISVAVGDYRSEADEDEAMREREETKRLLYVALTRARDRIYLSTVLKDGRVQPGRGSLAEVWPASLLEAFAAAYAGSDQIDWNVPTAVHRLRVIRPGEPPAVTDGRTRPAAKPAEWDFLPVADASRSRSSVGALVSSELSGVHASVGAQSDLVVGLLVHRLLQRFGMTGDLDPSIVETKVAELIRASGIDDEDALPVSREAISRFHTLRRHPRLQVDYETGEVFHEVPFTLSADGQMIRGAIDCLIRRPDGSIRLLEFKTGRRREQDTLQAEIYRRAAAAIFPDHVIEMDVLYTHDVAES